MGSRRAGPYEVHGFALLPKTLPCPLTAIILRPLDLRHQCSSPRADDSSHGPSPHQRDTLRSCLTCIVAADRLGTGTIARLIARYDPDVVALQELRGTVIRWTPGSSSCNCP